MPQQETAFKSTLENTIATASLQRGSVSDWLDYLHGKVTEEELRWMRCGRGEFVHELPGGASAGAASSVLHGGSARAGVGAESVRRGASPACYLHEGARASRRVCLCWCGGAGSGGFPCRAGRASIRSGPHSGAGPNTRSLSTVTGRRHGHGGVCVLRLIDGPVRATPQFSAGFCGA